MHEGAPPSICTKGVVKHLEVGAVVCTGGTDAGSFGGRVKITAVAALPDHRLRTGENGVGFDRFEQSAVTLFVVALGNANGIKDFGNGGEAFLTGDLGKAGI